MFAETKFFHKAGEGSGGSDPHNLGYYADLTALQTAYPTGTDGDFAILGSTDTIWVWDSGTSAWKDTDTKGQVTSVNGQTGAVTLTIPAAQVNSDWNASSGVAEILNKPTIPAAIQVSTMPTAAAGELDKIYQFIGTTDANYTNGYFYKCVSDGQDPATYSWTQTDVQPQAGGLPSQTGQSGKFLTTDGTDASWATINALQNTATGSGSIATGDYSQCPKGSCVVIGGYAKTDRDYGGNGSVVIGWEAEDKKSGYSMPSVVIGYQSKVTAQSNKLSPASCAIGVQAEVNAVCGTVLGGFRNKVTGEYAIQIGGLAQTNSETGTLYIGSYYNNAAVNYKLLDADGTIPAARHATLPAADGTYTLQVVITNGVPTLSWVAV